MIKDAMADAANAELMFFNRMIGFMRELGYAIVSALVVATWIVICKC